ncbi:MAG: hypothetical protein FWD75_04570 [Propionibacteriaceae bacterium]|nr:hypothetical protein [Propionibacteriaceae bacterium]
MSRVSGAGVGRGSRVPLPTVEARGPLALVRDAIAQGARTVPDIASHTGLDRGLVSAVVDHLFRTDDVRATRLTQACPAQGCGGCSLRGAC